MAEQVDLVTPVTKPSITNYRVSYMNLDIDNARITVFLTANNGETLQKVYDSTTAPAGATLLHALNTGNFATNSLLRAVYNRLIADGVIAGTVTGAAT
jgi:hypothetical protein